MNFLDDMNISEYKNLVSIRFPALDQETTRDGFPRAKINLVETVALEIFMEGTKSNSKLNIITRQLLHQYKDEGRIDLW